MARTRRGGAARRGDADRRRQHGAPARACSAGSPSSCPCCHWSGVYVGALPVARPGHARGALPRGHVGGRRLRRPAAHRGRPHRRGLPGRAAGLGGAGGPRAHPLRRLPVGAAGVLPGRHPAGPRRPLAGAPAGDRSPWRVGRRAARLAAVMLPAAQGRAWAARRGRRPPLVAVGARGRRAAGHRAADRRARRCRSRVVQGNVPQAGPGLQRPAPGRARQPRRRHRAARRARRAGRPQPDLVVWPENSSDIDPFRNPDAAAADRQRADRAIGVPILVGAVLDEPPGHGVERRARSTCPASPSRRALRQAAPGALRRVHPVPLVLPASSAPRSTWSRATSSPARVGVLQVPAAGASTSRDVDLLRGRLRRPGPRHASAPPGAEPARRADQQRDLRLHRRDRAAVRDVAAAGHRARPVGGARLDRRGVSALIAPGRHVIETTGAVHQAVQRVAARRAHRAHAGRPVGRWPRSALAAAGLVLVRSSGAAGRPGTRRPSRTDAEPSDRGRRHRDRRPPRPPLRPRRWSLIPTYNERGEPASRSSPGARRGARTPTSWSLDDNSPDGTGEARRRAGRRRRRRCTSLHRPGKEGLGAAYLAGFGWALDDGLRRAGRDGRRRLAPARAAAAAARRARRTRRPRPRLALGPRRPVRQLAAAPQGPQSRRQHLRPARCSGIPVRDATGGLPGLPGDGAARRSAWTTSPPRATASRSTWPGGPSGPG